MTVRYALHSAAQGRYRVAFRGRVIGAPRWLQTVRPPEPQLQRVRLESRREANITAPVIAVGLNPWRRAPEHITS